MARFRRTVLLHQIQARKRNVEAGGFGKFEQHEFGGAIAVVDFFQSLVLADAMLDVHYVVADLKVAEIG